MPKKQVLLLILDGWGYRDEIGNNSIAQAKTPNFDYLWANYPHAFLQASGNAVGLPTGVIGNSEVGHMTIGAGKVLNTDLVRISNSITSGDFKKNVGFEKLFEHIKKFDSTLHIVGLLSPIGVHSHQEHLHAFLELVKSHNIKKVVIHVITDGRDSPPKESAKYLKKLEEHISTLGIGNIVSMVGRHYAMDRDKNWERTQKAVDAIFFGGGEKVKNILPSKKLEEEYEKGINDEFLEPFVFLDENENISSIMKNDAIFIFNFRSDRPRQLCYKIMEKKKEENLFFVTMTEYSKDIDSVVAFPPQNIETNLACEISKAGLNQVHIAETEKYAHVTYFFNGGHSAPYENEKHILIDSRKDIISHDMAPEMRATEIADAVIKSIEDDTNFILVNFANADMVGHTANMPAIVKGVEMIDMQIGRIMKTLENNGGVAFITADHGNAEENIDIITGERHTAHTLNTVPAIFTEKGKILQSGSLSDVAPTILNFLNLEVPLSMTGKNLLINNN